MSVKIYFILLSCLAYYAMSVPTETNKPNEDVTIPVVDSVEDSTTIAEQVKQEENPPTTTLQDDQLDVCWESFQKANEEGRKIPLKNILLFINYSKEYIENFDHVVEIMRQRGLMDSDMITFDDLTSCIEEFSNQTFAVLSSDVITALSDAVKKETDKSDGKITFKKLESVMEKMPENWALKEFKTYLLQNVFVDENRSISHEEFTEAMAVFNDLEIEQDDFEEYNTFAVLSSDVITALSDAVKKETDKGDGKITFKKLKSILETMPENWELTEFEIYLFDNVFVNENHSISHEEFREAMAEFNELENEQDDFEEYNNSVLSGVVITALSDAVKKETDKGDGKITFKKLESVMETMTENLALAEFKTYLLQNVFVDENHSISHEEFREAMAEFNDFETEQDDLEENDNSVLSGLVITALRYAVKKETDRNDGKISFETLKSVMETMPPDLDLSAFEIYLKEKVFFNDYHLISHDEFTKAMAEFNKLEKQKIIFSRIDLDGNNKINADEILNHMKKKGNFRSLENIEKTIKQYALEDKNCLNFDEFRQMMATKENRKFWNEEFDEMDLNNDGILSIDELRVGMEKLFGKVPEVQVQKTFRSLVVDTDGKVTKEGYVASDGI